MPEILAAPLIEAATDTFAALAFFFVEAGDPSQSLAVDGVAVVDFDGPIHGRLAVRLSGGVLPALAANMLGDDESPSLVMQRDALGEVANVICGNVLPRLVGAAAVFNLRAPRLDLGFDEACTIAHRSAAHASLIVEQGRADLALLVFDADLCTT